MEIRKGRGFPQPLEKSLAKDARLFHSSHRPDDEDLSTIYYCRQRSLRTRREQVRESTAILGKGGDIAPFPRPLTLLEDARTLLRKRKLCPNNLCHLKGSPHACEPILGLLSANWKLPMGCRLPDSFASSGGFCYRFLVCKPRITATSRHG